MAGFKTRKTPQPPPEKEPTPAEIKKIIPDSDLPKSCFDAKKISSKTRGQRTKYSPDIVRGLLWNYRQGLSLDAAATRVGVDRKTFFSWRAKYDDLNDALNYQRSCLQADLVSHVKRAIAADGRNALQLLERLFPQDFGYTSRQRIEGTVNHDHKLDHKHLAQLQQLRAKRDAQQVVDVEVKQIEGGE